MVRVTLREKESYFEASFTFPNCEYAGKVIDVLMTAAEGEIEFKLENISLEQEQAEESQGGKNDGEYFG